MARQRHAAACTTSRAAACLKASVTSSWLSGTPHLPVLCECQRVHATGRHLLHVDAIQAAHWPQHILVAVRQALAILVATWAAAATGTGSAS